MPLNNSYLVSASNRSLAIRSVPLQQRGFSLIVVIFIIVVLAGLATVMMRISGFSSDSVAREVLSTRALLAAESGAQRQLNIIFNAGTCTGSSESFTFAAFSGCDAVLTQCTQSAVSGKIYYTVSSTGRCGPSGGQAVREVEVKARQL